MLKQKIGQKFLLLMQKMFPQSFPLLPKSVAIKIKTQDVTAFAADIDLSALEVITWTPMWMSRAERLLLYTLAFCLQPTRYLEIGTFQGGSALVVAAAMDARKSDGQMICIDPEPKITPENWAKIKHRATLLTGFSPAILPQALEVAGKPFDFVLIDGDHTYQGAIRDAEGVLPYVANGGYLLFHDNFFTDVGQAIDDFVAKHPYYIVDFGCLTREVTTESLPNGETRHWGGLRLMQVRQQIVR